MKKLTHIILILIICSISAYAQPTWVTSGAAIGDESTFLYTENTTITFDATDDAIDLSSSLFSTTDATQAYSFATWVKVTNGATNHVIISQYLNASTDTDQFELIINATGQLEYKKYTTTIATSTTVVNNDTWYHVAFTKTSAGAITLYINATADGTGTDNLDYAASNTYIGAKDNSNFFDGKIDEVKIWNTALTETQIFNSMYGTYAPEANIIAVYDFEKGSGTTLTDVSSNSNDGIIAGTPIWNTTDEIITEVKIKDEKGDILTISNWGGTTSPDGVQIYKVNDTPNDVTTTGKAGTIIPGHYWGVFPANGDAPTYDLELMYNGYKTWSDESQLDLAYRSNNASGAWTSNLDVTLDMPNDKMTKSVAAPSRNEYHLMYEIPPEPGNCLQFDGSDAWVSIPTNTAPNNWSAITTYTIEVWVKPTDSDGCHIWEGNNGTSRPSLEGGATSASGYIFYADNTNCGSTGTLTLNKWYHITCSYDDAANEAKFYLDGVLIKTTSISSTNTFGNVFYLADRQGGGFANNDRDFPGYIDELRIWDDVRTATEIQDHMHKEFSTEELSDATTDNLMAYYNFNHFGNTTTVTDYKANNDGTLKNNADNADGETTGPIWKESTVFNRWWGTDDGAWAVRNNWSKGRSPIVTDNIGIHQVKGTPDIVKNSPTLATTTLEEVDDFTVGSNAVFTASAGEQLTVNDPFTINGIANFKSPTDLTASASLITKSTVQGSGTTNAERYMTANNWHYFASPVDVQNSSQFVATNLYSWSETIADSWSANDFINDIMGWTSFSGNFTPGTGYVAYETTAGTKTFSGNVNSGNQTVNLNYTDNTATHSDAMFDGWNLVGNPYPSAIDWTSGNITKTNIDAAIYFYDDNGSGNYDNYKYYVDGGGDDDYYPAISANEGSQYIPAFQSVFIKANNSGASTILFTNNCRKHSTANFYKGTEKGIAEQELIRLQAEKDGVTDQTVIRFLSEASNEYDGQFDAYKLFSTSEQVPQIYTITPNNNWLAISSLPEYDTETVIPLGFRSGTTGTCKITATELNFDEQTNIYLKDLYLNKIIDLKEIQIYEFETNNQNYYDRFQLVFKSSQTEINQLEKNNDVSIYSHSNIVNILINSENISAELEIYNILGQKIYHNNISSDNTKIQLNAPTGNYIVKLKYKEQIITKKVFINN